MKRIILSILVLGLGLISCNKEGCMDPGALNYNDKANKDDGACVYQEATLTILNPEEGQLSHKDDVVNIKAIATNNEVLHGWSLYLYNKTTLDTLFQENDHAHNVELSIEVPWANTLEGEADIELGVRVTVDHDGAELFKKVTFKSLP